MFDDLFRTGPILFPLGVIGTLMICWRVRDLSEAWLYSLSAMVMLFLIGPSLPLLGEATPVNSEDFGWQALPRLACGFVVAALGVGLWAIGKFIQSQIYGQSSEK